MEDFARNPSVDGRMSKELVANGMLFCDLMASSAASSRAMSLVLSRPFAQPFFQHLAPNVGFMAADLKEEYKGFRGLNALYRRLVAKQFTAVADFHNVLRTRFLRLRFLIDGKAVNCFATNRR